MKLGLFSMPTNPPGRPLAESLAQTMDVIEYADALGYAEVWLGEHLTVPWEPLPACDLIIAQALVRTEQIKLCSGAYLLPYYHPAELACRIMQLDHMAAGRFICGVAPGFSPTDQAFIGLEPGGDVNRRMMVESLEIMKRIWTDHVGATWEYEGEFWTVRNPAPIGHHRPHLRPYQLPHPPIAVAGQTPRSGTIRFAGENGYIPISLVEAHRYVAEHWDMYSEAAAVHGHPADRDSWRVVRNVFVADTDEEARAWLRGTPVAGYWQQAVIEGFRKRGILDTVKHDPSVPDHRIDLDYFMDHWWLVGSPDTVLDKLSETNDAVGGFGTLLMPKYDYADQRGAYMRNLELLAKEVLPAFEARHTALETA